MSQSSIPTESPTPVDIGAIEKELMALWKQPKGNGEGEPQVTRACVLTLVAPVSGWRHANEVTQVVAALTDRYPNRAIVVDTAPNETADAMDAWVQAHCQLPGPGHSQICCEQITITAKGPAVARSASVVLPLLVPDVPVVLWWSHGEPFDSPLFARLCDFADRVIVDSTTFTQPEQRLTQLVALVDQRRTVSDLAWGRLTPWREVTAQFFDSPTAVVHLHELDRVTLRYRPRPDGTLDRTQPLLFAGWLASKLGWKIGTAISPQAEADLVLARPDGGEVTIELRPLASGDHADEQLDAVELQCAHAVFHITRTNQESALATARVEGAAPLKRAVRIARADSATLLAEELRLLGHDKGYEGALKAAAAIAG